MCGTGIVAGCIIAVNVFHTVCTLPLLVWFVTRRNPYRHLKGMVKAATVAAGSASSAVTRAQSCTWCTARAVHSPLGALMLADPVPRVWRR